MSSSHRRAWLTVSPLLIGSLIACGGGQDNTPSRDPSTANTTSSTTTSSTDNSSTAQSANTQDSTPPNSANTTATTTSMGSADTHAQQAQPAPLTDPQIGSVTDAANQGEIDQAKLALTKSKDAKVKRFAQMMIDHHGQAKAQQAALFTKLKINAEPSTLSAQLTGDAGSALDNLKSQSGSDFDKSYMDLQVKQHQKVLDMFDQTLLPAVQNADFKTALTNFRPKVAQHLADAQRIDDQVHGGGKKASNP